MDGGHKSVTIGLCGYRSLLANHHPKVMRNCHSYMDPAASELNTSVVRMGKLLQQKKKIFTIETTVNNRMFDRPLEFLAKNEDDLSAAERMSLRALKLALDKTPQGLRQTIFNKVPSPYGVTGVWAGETEAVHAHTLRKGYEQYLVPVTGQADILITGVPYISPYNVNAFLNPLLVQVMVNGYLFNLYKGAPMVKKGGTMIVLHPCTDKFDNDQHAPYIEFVHRILPETRDAMELHKRYERKFAANPAYIEMYRSGHAYHPAHAFFMWYWGEAGRQHVGRDDLGWRGASDEHVQPQQRRRALECEERAVLIALPRHLGLQHLLRFVQAPAEHVRGNHRVGGVDTHPLPRITEQWRRELARAVQLERTQLHTNAQQRRRESVVARTEQSHALFDTRAPFDERPLHQELVHLSAAARALRQDLVEPRDILLVACFVANVRTRYRVVQGDYLLMSESAAPRRR